MRSLRYLLAGEGLPTCFGVTSSIADNTWFGINPISAGVFGVPLGFAVIIIVSLFTAEPTLSLRAWLDGIVWSAVFGAIAGAVFVAAYDVVLSRSA